MKATYTLLLSAAAILGGTLSVGARQLSEAEALAAATRVAPAGMHRAPRKITPHAVATGTANGLRTYYVFNTSGDNGYMIVAADDVATPLLGYSDSGMFDPASVPPQMQWWLDGYSSQIAAAASSPQAANTRYYSPRHKSERHAVAPITKTLWNQDAPYNDFCPMLTDAQGQSERAVTGCVATAMAQVMKVHNYPAAGIGQHSYSFSYNGVSYNESLNFSSTSFRWDKMLNTYTNGTITTDNNNAVASLMYACGVAVDMSYGLAATDGSGAVSFNAAKALVDYFGYDKGIQYLQRNNYSYDDWTDIVYREVAAGRPVLYGGQSSEGGHEFVCDGYSSDDYFHFNWGWGGMSDGYFLLSALDPASQGIGGSNSGFNMSQDIICGIQPPVEGSQIVPQMVWGGDFTPASSEYFYGQTMVFGSQSSTMVYSLSVGDIQCTLGLKLTDPSGNVQYIAGSNSSSALPSQQGWYTLSVDASEMPSAGTYTVAPAFRSNGTWYDVATSLGSIGYVTATCSDGYVSFTVPSDAPAIEITSVTQNTPYYIGQAIELLVDVEASGEFYGEVMPAIVSGGSIVAIGTPKGLTYSAGDTDHIDWIAEFNSPSTYSGLSAGDYNLVFISPQGRAYSQEYPIVINPQQRITPEIAVTSVYFNNASGAGTSTDPYLVDPNNLSATIGLSGVAGYWAQNVVGGIFNMQTGREITTFGSDFVGLQSGDSKQITLTGSVSTLTDGTVYVFIPWANTSGQLTDNFTYISPISSVGITDIEAPGNHLSVSPTLAADFIDVSGVAEGSPIAIYTTSGVMALQSKAGQGVTHIDISTLPHGYYLVNAAGSTVKMAKR